MKWITIFYAKKTVKSNFKQIRKCSDVVISDFLTVPNQGNCVKIFFLSHKFETVEPDGAEKLKNQWRAAKVMEER